MNERLEMKVNELLKEVRRETLSELVEILWKKTEEIDQLLENSYNIIKTANGERFTKLFEKRLQLRKKSMHYTEVIATINEIRFK